MSRPPAQQRNSVVTGSDAGGHRRIWLCADDYGISPSVSLAIRDLAARGRINATSVMVAAPSFQRAEANALDIVNTNGPRIAVGLHVTLTAPFRPLSQAFKPAQDGRFLPLMKMGIQSCLRRLNPAALEEEIAAQLRRFVDLFGRAPRFIDGHQHVHLFPQVRDALLDVSKESAPRAWVRQCGSPLSVFESIRSRKGLPLDLMSRTFRRRAIAQQRKTNPAFAGAYDYRDDVDFAALFPRFLDRLPDGGVVMCHPGFVDAELRRLDPLTILREREYAYFCSDAFPDVLAAHGLTLAPASTEPT
jgi:chitin disaccharide deacetylase